MPHPFASRYSAARLAGGDAGAIIFTAYKGISPDCKGISSDCKGISRAFKGIFSADKGISPDCKGISRDCKGSSPDDKGSAAVSFIVRRAYNAGSLAYKLSAPACEEITTTEKAAFLPKISA